MGAVSFEIVKKLEKVTQPASGYLLSSLCGDENGLRCVIAGDGLDEVKKLVQSMRSEGCGLLCKSRGKSLEITGQRGVARGAFDSMLALLSRLDFASDGVTDMISFCSGGCEDFDRKLTFDFADCDRGSMSVRIIAELEEGADAGMLYEELTPLLDKYGLGIIKDK